MDRTPDPWPIVGCMDVDDQGAAIAFLSNPASCRGDMTRVERMETHASIAFLAGRAGIQLKRAVRFISTMAVWRPAGGPVRASSS